MGCAFCATARLGLQRNLARRRDRRPGARRARACCDADERLTNIVFMGMGEPLANYDAVVEAIEILTADWGLGLSGAPHHRVDRRPGAADASAWCARPRVSIAVSLTAHDRRAARRADAGQPPLSARRADGHLPRAADRAAPPHHVRVRPARRRQRLRRRRRPPRHACCTASAPRSISSPSIPFPAPASRRRRRGRRRASSSACSRRHQRHRPRHAAAATSRPPAASSRRPGMDGWSAVRRSRALWPHARAEGGCRPSATAICSDGAGSAPCGAGPLDAYSPTVQISSIWPGERGRLVRRRWRSAHARGAARAPGLESIWHRTTDDARARHRGQLTASGRRQSAARADRGGAERSPRSGDRRQRLGARDARRSSSSPTSRRSAAQRDVDVLAVCGGDGTLPARYRAGARLRPDRAAALPAAARRHDEHHRALDRLLGVAAGAHAGPDRRRPYGAAAARR